MGALLSAVILWFKGKTVLEIAIHLAKWLAFVAFIRFVLFIALGAAVTQATGFMLNFVMEGLRAVWTQTGVQAPPVLQLVGLAGWLANQLQLPTIMSILLTGLSFKFVRSVVPFL